MTDPRVLVAVLGYNKITESFHIPMMEDMWNRDMRRPFVREMLAEQVELGLLPKLFLDTAMAAGPAYYKDEGECWARDHYKTTVFIVRCAKLALLCPRITIGHWHAVEKKAIEASDELGDHFMTNREFRALRMEIMPKTTNKKFVTRDGFSLDDFQRIRQLYGQAGKHIPKERHPTFFPKGASAVVTGGHCWVGWLDDIVDENTINDSQMPVVRAWLGKTVSHVVRTDGGVKWATYTPWDEDDVMVDWEKDKAAWECRVRACRETEGKPDYEGVPVLYDERWIKKKQRDPQIDFPYQMMCDRVPDSERRWPLGWAGHCKKAWAMEGNGRIFVLSDPAPMGLSLRGEKDRVRGTTGKDWWAISVVRLRVRGDFQDMILMDGSASQQWSDAEGYDEACRLMKFWGTNLFLDEDYSGGQGFEAFWKATRRNGVMPYTELDGKGRRMWPKYLESYVSKAKNKRFQKLCDMASAGAVWIAESCPEAFWKGDGDLTGALTQAAKWIPRKGGESSLKWDDHFDSWARATDRKLQQFAPQPRVASDASVGLSPWEYAVGEDMEEPMRTRYCGQ